MRYGEGGGRIWSKNCSFERLRLCITHGFLICSSTVLFADASCVAAETANSAGTAYFCGPCFQAQNPKASDHEAVAGLASFLTGDGNVEAGGGATVIVAGAMIAGFSPFAAAAAAKSLFTQISEDSFINYTCYLPVVLFGELLHSLRL